MVGPSKENTPQEQNQGLGKQEKFRRAGKPANTFDHVSFFSQTLTSPVRINLKSAKAFQMRIAIGANDAL